MNKYSKYDILDGITSFRIGFLSILGEIPNLKQFELDIPNLNVDLFRGLIDYIKSKDFVKISYAEFGKGLFISYFDYNVLLEVYPDKIILKLDK